MTKLRRVVVEEDKCIEIYSGQEKVFVLHHDSVQWRLHPVLDGEREGCEIDKSQYRHDLLDGIGSVYSLINAANKIASQEVMWHILRFSDLETVGKSLEKEGTSSSLTEEGFCYLKSCYESFALRGGVGQNPSARSVRASAL